MPRHKYDEHLKVVVETRKQYGLPLAPPLSEEDLRTLNEEIRKLKSTDIPEAYLDFLRRIDGLIWNGFYVYGSKDRRENGRAVSDGLIGENEDWKDEPYLYLASDGEGFYVYDPGDQRFKELSNSGDELFAYDSFDDLLNAGFENNKP